MTKLEKVSLLLAILYVAAHLAAWLIQPHLGSYGLSICMYGGLAAVLVMLVTNIIFLASDYPNR